MDLSGIDFIEIVTVYGLNLILAILTLVIGLWVISWIMTGIRKGLERGDIEPTLKGFVTNFLSVLLKILVYISALSVLGVEMTSFIAILAAAGLAIGLALSGTLQNFAGGVMILFFKPFKAGHFIEAQGHMGTVREIQIFVTVLTTPDNKTIIIPNGPLATDTLTNFSIEEKRRVDWTFGIAYGDDLDKAYGVLRRLLGEDDRIMDDPEPFLALKELGDSSVNIAVRAWVDAAEYWPVFFHMNEQVYKTFDKEGLSIPFPQRDVHLFREN
ncbi:MAG: mechanosensitive ion channel domain-containing protein [Balneolaceae bacterium]